MGPILAGTLLLTATGLFSQVVGFFYRIALSRVIGAESMGLYQLVIPVYSMLMSLTGVGFTVAVATLSARNHALGDSGAVRDVLRRALGCFCSAAIPLGVAVVLASDPISVYLLGDARTRLGLVLLVPCVLLTGVENLHKHCFYGMGKVVPPALSETVEQLVRAGAVLGLLIWLAPRTGEQRVGVIVLGMVVCEVCSALTLAVLFHRHWRRNPTEPPTVRYTARRLWAIALPVGGASLLGTLLGVANSVLIPARLVAGGMESGEAIAAFGVICGMTMPMLALPTGVVGPLCLVMVPDLARRTAGGDQGAAGGFLDRVMTTTSVLMAPAMALLTVIGPVLGRTLFRQPGAGELMLPLAAGTLLTCWQTVLSGALNGLGLQGKGARNAIVSDGVQLVFTWFAVPEWGLAGFAAGFVLSALVGMGMNLISVLGATGLKMKAFSWFGAPLLAAVLMGMWCNLFFRILRRGGFGDGTACLLCGVLGVILYGAALLAQGVRLPRKAKGRKCGV